MTLGIGKLEKEIRALERQIAVDREALDHALRECRNGMRTAAGSPKVLFVAAGIGFAVGKLLFPRKGRLVERRSRKSGWLGVLAGTALSLAQPGLGMGTLARWALRVLRDRVAGEEHSAAAAHGSAGSRRGTPRHAAARQYRRAAP